MEYVTLINAIIVIIIGIFGGSAGYLLARRKANEYGLVFATTIEALGKGFIEMSELGRDALVAVADNTITTQEAEEIRKHGDNIIYNMGIAIENIKPIIEQLQKKKE